MANKSVHNFQTFFNKWIFILIFEIFLRCQGKENVVMCFLGILSFVYRFLLSHLNRIYIASSSVCLCLGSTEIHSHTN